MTDVFACGASYYGVADLAALAATTHDFESRYVERLVGDPQADPGILEARSPLSHVDGLSVPVLLLQGAEDVVVPPAQAEVFRDVLVRKGIAHAYLLFEGEQHGFRKAESMVRALEAELSFYGQVMGFEPPGVPVLPLVGDLPARQG
jgi:dipeptidyl aminopeptidase/acylaminoacyl peptidase